MAIVSATDMMMKATEGKYAIGAFNCTNLIQMEAVVEAASDLQAPLIIQTSVTPARFLGPRTVAAIFRTLAESAPVAVCLHLDHCNDMEFCKECADAGYTNIMIDASQQDIKTNIRQTREIAEYCHALGDISVEGELGTVSGVEDQVSVVEDEAQLCDPEHALEFVKQTGIDIFAPAIGTAHGVYKTANPKIDFERLAQTASLINGHGVRAPLVIHGGTGLQPDVVEKLVSLGGAKFNVSTDLKHVLIDATFSYISMHRDEYNPGKVDLAAKQAIKERVSYWIRLLGSSGKDKSCLG